VYGIPYTSFNDVYGIPYTMKYSIPTILESPPLISSVRVKNARPFTKKKKKR